MSIPTFDLMNQKFILELNAALAIKLKEKDSRTKICFLTASEMYHEKFRKARDEFGRTIGEDYFIQKPIKTEDLIKKFTSIMNIKNKYG